MAKDKTDIDVPHTPTGTHVLKVKKGDTTYSIKLYDTEAGAGTPATTTGTLKLRMGGANYYARITQYLESGAAGGATPLRYKSASGNVYQVTQKGEFAIIVPASSGQTVCVSANGQTYKGANTLWFADGTPWNAWVETDVNHIAGNLNLTGGTLNSGINLSVSSAITIPSGSTSYNDSGSFTVPAYINVLHVVGTSGLDLQGDFNHSYNIRVTPGRTYSITTRTQRFKSGSSYHTRDIIVFNGLDISGTTYHTHSMSISWSGTINGYQTDHDFS